MKDVRWEGRNTDGSITYRAEGISYKDLYETIEDKYGIDYITDEDAKYIKLLEINDEPLDEYDITTDGIGNDEKLDAFLSRDDIKPLSEKDYRDIINSSTGNAYYHIFHESSSVEYTDEYGRKHVITGFIDDIKSEIIDILEQQESKYEFDFEDLIYLLENETNDMDVLMDNLNDFIDKKWHHIQFKVVE